MDARRAVAVAREVVIEIRENNITFMAGSIAHSAFISLLPLLLLILVIAAAVGSELLTEPIIELARDHLSPAGEGLVYDALLNATERGGTTLIGVVTLVWGMLRIFRGINTAFGELYGGTDDTIVDQVVDGLVVFVSITLATIGTGLVSALRPATDSALAMILNPVRLVVGLVVAFFPMFYIFPEPDVSAREVLPGTILAAIGWAALEGAFGLYVALVDTVGTYGLLGAVIVLLVWLYAAAFVLLSAVTVNVVLAGRHVETEGLAEEESAADGTVAP